MGSHMQNGRFASYDDVVLQDTVTRTASGAAAAVECAHKSVACLDLVVSAASGTTPSLTVAIETSKDGSTWRNVASFTAATAVTSERKSFVGLDRYVRANATISGTTPSFTYKVSGDLKG